LAPTGLNAVDKDKAVYIGGTLSSFPQGGRTVRRFNAEGRIDTQADSQLVFDTGTRGKITIPYSAIVSFTFGRHEPFGVYDAVERRGARVLPKDFYSKNDFLLTIVYQDPPETEQVIVLWLGNDIVPRWTSENRPFIDTANPAIPAGRSRPVSSTS
jgi:hypothetical protein